MNEFDDNALEEDGICGIIKLLVEFSIPRD